MNILRRETVCRVFSVSTLVSAVSVLVIAAGCGDSSSSPSSPSAVSPSGSIISGQINGGSAQTASGALNATTLGSTGAGMTVTVEGTGKSTTADSAGRFMLTGLSEGRLLLRFTGSGADARLPLTVARNERVDIAVRVSGSTATIESERHLAADVDDEAGELEGQVANRAGTCPNITFTVNGTKVMTNSATKFEDGPCTQVLNGARVEVKGGPPVNGVVLATVVEVYF